MMVNFRERFKRNSFHIIFFFLVDSIVNIKSYFLDLSVLNFKELRKIKVKEISKNSIKDIMGKYSYFGEFGYFHFSVLGGLSQYFKINPDHKIKIVTYENYGKILELAFPKNVKAYCTDYKFNEAYRACHYYHDRVFRMSIKKLGFTKNIAKDLIYKTKGLPKIKLSDGGVFFHIIKPLKYPLSRKKEKFVSICPRFRSTGTDRNANKKTWDKIIKLLQKYNYKIIVHNYSSEFIKLQNKKLIYPKDIYEQIMYLNNSDLCITPFSGTQHFAQNCGCDILVIIGNNPKHFKTLEQHSQFNPFKTKIYGIKEYPVKNLLEEIKIILNINSQATLEKQGVKK